MLKAEYRKDKNYIVGIMKAIILGIRFINY
jgi:hypothetical protein